MYHRLLRQALSRFVEAEGTRFDVRSLETVEQSRLSSGIRLSCRLLYQHVPPRLLTQSLEWRLLIVPSPPVSHFGVDHARVGPDESWRCSGYVSSSFAITSTR